MVESRLLKPLGPIPADPVEYARQVLKIEPTPDQCQILRALTEPPRKVLVPAAHNCGKTHCAAMAVNWWFDLYPRSVVLTTAPTKRDVVDLLWAEVRMQRARVGLPGPFSGPRAPELFESDEHYAKGFTAGSGEGFKGRHRPRMLFIFDEANEIEPSYWTTTRTMFDPSEGHAWLAIFNPTSSTTQAYQEDMVAQDWSGRDADKPWERIPLSALTHPNVLAGLAGKPKDIPGAVSKEQIDDHVREWCEPINARDREATDIDWPPGSGNWFRPGPDFQSRVCGQWPTTGTELWTDPLWQACLTSPPPAFPLARLPVIGCDCAQGKSQDYHAIHCRWGNVSVHHETANVMDAERIFERLKVCCQRMADLVMAHRPTNTAPVPPQTILIQIDDDGTGAAVASFLRKAGYRCLPIGAGTRANNPDRYPRRRDELWFETAQRARRGEINVSQLDRGTRRRLKAQLVACEWELDTAGKRKVSTKEEMFEKIKRSPDDADALILAFTEMGTAVASPVESQQERPGVRPGQTQSGRPSLYGGGKS